MLDVKQRETMRALSSPQVIHGAVEQSVAGKNNRNLWRIDWLNDICYLLVLSHEKPDFTHITKQFGFPSLQPTWETKNYYLLLSRLQAGQEWHFRLRANPTRSSFKEKEKTSGRGKVFAHVTSEQQKQWLLSRAESCGFKLEENKFDIVQTQWFKFSKGNDNGREVSLHTVVFEGKLTIVELEKFKQTLLYGVGRAKAYGCGLLTIARSRANGHGK
jgi:CRISPR system Cascade subunit CasE